jgi:hypothetical protein
MNQPVTSQLVIGISASTGGELSDEENDYLLVILELITMGIVCHVSLGVIIYLI